MSGPSIIKLLFGWIALSQAVVTDGILLLSDLLSDALVAHATEDPDTDQPYGLGRFQTLTILVLILVAVGVLAMIDTPSGAA